MLDLRSEFEKLNGPQKVAVEHTGNVVVLAGPGSGKTATLVLKMTHLLEEVLPPFVGLACITYNNEAVREIRKRSAELGIHQGRQLFIGTVHSFCLNRILRPYAGQIIPRFKEGIVVASSKHADLLLEKALYRNGISETLGFYKPIMTCLRRQTICEEDTTGYADADFAVLAEYERSLRTENLVDFESMVGLSVEILRAHEWVTDLLVSRFPWLVIDEYQDLGGPLHHIVTSMADHGAKIFAVGDPDQTIYDFTGADPRYLLELSKRNDFNTIRLKFNYRSGKKLIDASQAALSPDEPRDYKADPKREDQGEVFFIEAEETLEDHASKAIEAVRQAIESGIAPEEIAIVYLNKNVLLDEVRNELDRVRIPFIAERDSKYPTSPIIRWLQDTAAWTAFGGTKGEHLFEDILRFYGHLLIDSGRIESYLVTLDARRHLFETLTDPVDEYTGLGVWLRRIVSELELKELLTASGEHVDDVEALGALVEMTLPGECLEDTRLLEFASDGRVRGKVVLTTFHSSKGRQFDWVVIPGLVEGILPRWKWNWSRKKYDEPSGKSLNEARRLFYVGFTRARMAVCLVHSTSYRYKGHLVSLGTGISRFASEIQERLESG